MWSIFKIHTAVPQRNISSSWMDQQWFSCSSTELCARANLHSVAFPVLMLNQVSHTAEQFQNWYTLRPQLVNTVNLAIRLLEPDEIIMVTRWEVLIQCKFALPAWNPSNIVCRVFEKQKAAFIQDKKSFALPLPTQNLYCALWLIQQKWGCWPMPYVEKLVPLCGLTVPQTGFNQQGRVSLEHLSGFADRWLGQ